MAILKVWIERGCTICGICEEECPEVFELGDESAVMKDDVNLAEYEDSIISAVESCPVQIIQYAEK